MFSSRVTSEQGDSLARALKTAGHEHGDTAVVELEGVGVVKQFGQPHLAFCPAKTTLLETTQPGTTAERQQPMPSEVKLSRSVRKQIRQELSNFKGFATMRCTVHSNGQLHISAIKIVRKHRWEGHVSHRDSYHDFQALCAIASRQH